MGWNNPPLPWHELERRLSWGDKGGERDSAGPRPVTRLPASGAGRADRVSRADQSSLASQHDRVSQAARASPEPAWAELHCHSSYSFLDGASSPAELVAEAARLGLEALAITDHNGMYGVPQFAQAAAKLTEQTGIRLGTVFGAELSVGCASPGERPPGTPRWPQGPVTPSRRLGPCWPGGATPRWPQGPVTPSRGLAP